MRTIVVVTNPSHWPLEAAGVEVVPARRYLTDPDFMKPGLRVINLCRSYRYQSVGYYVSLLASARGHRPLPDNITARDLQEPSLFRLVTEDLEEQIQRSLGRLQGDRFTLSVYFGRNLARQHMSLSQQLFRVFQAPLLRAEFVRKDRWIMQSVRPITVSDVPDTHRDFLLKAVASFLTSDGSRVRKRKPPRFDLAMLVDEDELLPPSNERALKKFERAAEQLGVAVERIARNDSIHLLEFDGLFIRTTTSVNHYTYRFARRAEAEGMVVIDDPTSIVRCTNKVYLAERLARARISIPKTRVVHAENLVETAADLGMPCILKRPDSSFSDGVVKAATVDDFYTKAKDMLTRSELVIAQEFMPTNYDWRVGVLDGHPIYVCKYYMSGGHWQIIERCDSGEIKEGKVDTFSVEDAPPNVVRTAVQAANLIGKGLYGVDLKQIGRTCKVIEINDNPSIDAGFEDRVVKDALYTHIMGVFLKRMEARRQ
jgi:glutathione synthase/RimK-type ligase-like ATP-grasp enzyme